MDQTTTFNPHVSVRLLDGRLVAFARSTMSHWVDLCERMHADRADAVVAEIDAIPADQLKPVARVQARADARDFIVPIDYAIRTARTAPRWITEHLTMAFVEAGGKREDADGVLRLIPPVRQAAIADQLAMLPVVKGASEGTEANPLTAGLDQTGASTSSPSSDTPPASTPAD